MQKWWKSGNNSEIKEQVDRDEGQEGCEIMERGVLVHGGVK